MEKNNLYELVKGEGSDPELERYRQCFEKNGTLRQLESLVWMHQRNLAHTNLIYYGIEKSTGNIAAIYTVVPVMVTVEGKKVIAMQSVDTLTDVDHRGKGLFIQLAKKLYDNASESGFAFVYGFPNSNSGPGFFKKLGWQSFGEVPFLIKPLRLSYFFKKILRSRSSSMKEEVVLKAEAPPGYQFNGMMIKKIEEFGSDYLDLWKSFKSNIQIGVDRSDEYLNWRFNKPGEFYYRYGLYRDNQLIAIVVFTIKEKHDGMIGYIMEFMYNPVNVKEAKKLLGFATKFIRSQKADFILAWCLPHSTNYLGYKGAGFMKLPEKFRPLQLFFGVKPLQENSSTIITTVENWYISYVDSDSV